MNITIEFVDQNDVDGASLDGAQQALPPLPFPDRVTLVVSGNLVGSVNRRGHHGTEHVPYTQDRLTGMVGAKTVHRGEMSEIIVVAQPFRRGNRDAYDGLEMPRIIRHEGWHVVLFQRNEELDQLWTRLPDDLPESDSYLLGISISGLTEARIERVLWGEGRKTASRAGETEDTLEQLRVALLQAVIKRSPNESILRTFQQAYSAFNQLVTHLCYIAAEDADASGPGLSTISESLWERFVDDYWNRLVEVSDGLPTAAEATPPDHLLRLYLATVPLFRDWFRHIGFLLEERDGGMYLDIVRSDF